LCCQFLWIVHSGFSVYFSAIWNDKLQCSNLSTCHWVVNPYFSCLWLLIFKYANACLQC
jgi:hypothetical protein